MEKRSLARLAMAGIVAGGFALTACNESTSSKTETPAGIAAAKTLGDFQAACEQAGGMFKNHDCQSMNECKGHSYQEGKGIASHECKGHSACKGGSCVES